MIKSTKKALVDEIEERNELSKTRATVMAKQEERVKQSITEQETKINEMIKNATTGATPPKTNLPK
jgi:prefoldin beta subunit